MHYKRGLLSYISVLYLYFNVATSYSYQPTQLIYFGDSFTAFPGFVTWADFLSQRYNRQAFLGRTNFALAGHDSLSLTQERNAYFAAINNIDDFTIHLTYSGLNDFAGAAFAAAQVNDFIGGTLPGIIGPSVSAFMDQRLNLIIDHARQLFIRGSKNQVIFNHLNQDLRRLAFQPLNFVIEEWNRRLYQGLRQLNTNIILIDFFRLTTEIQQSLAAFLPTGITFYDATDHPTPEGHQIIAQYVASVIEAPNRVALALELPLKGVDILFQQISASIDGHKLLQKSQKNIRMFFIGQIGYDDFKPLTPYQMGWFDSSPKSGGVGISATLSSQFEVGFLYNRYQQIAPFASRLGQASVNENLFALFGHFKIDTNFWATGAMGGGYATFDIKRNIQLGLSQRTQRGGSNAPHFYIYSRLGTFVALPDGWNLKPFIGFGYQKINGIQYTEKGTLSSTSMSFKIPDRDSLKIHGGGLVNSELEFNGIKWLPFLEAQMEYEMLSLNPNIQGKVSDLPFYFKAIGPTLVSKWDTKFNIGSEWQFNSIQFNLAYQMILDFNQKSEHRLLSQILWKLI